MKKFIRKLFKKCKIYRKIQTEKIDGLILTYEPSTDIGGMLYKGLGFERSEIEIASKYIKDDSIVLDIGANIGIHSLKFSKIAKDGLVIACEPQPRTFEIFKKNITQNNIRNIIPLNLAISEVPQISDFYVMQDDAYSSLINTHRKRLSNIIQVLCTSVDGLFGEINFDFVKIDVEGLEYNVLLSMDKMIRRCRPIIFCEIYKGKIETYNPSDVISYLESIGYETYRVVDGELTLFPTGSIHEDHLYNYFFFPDNLI